MKLVRLDTEGYRSLKRVIWEPGKLNVVIGPNSSGKSNLLKLLKLIGISAQGDLNRHILSDGGMGAILWDGQVDTIAYNVNLAEPGTRLDVYSYGVNLTRLGQTASFIINFEELFKRLLDANSENIFLERRSLDGWFQGHSGPIRLDSTTLKQDETLLSQVSAPMGGSTEITDCRKTLASWAIYDELHTDRDSEIRRATTARYEERLDSDGQNLVPVLHTHYTNDIDFKDRIDEAMTAAFGDEYRELTFPPGADQQVQMRVRWKSLKRPQPAAALSDGTLRFLYVITALAQPNPPPLIAIDEPETGLHPSMMRIIAEYAANAALQTQVIFTTHSAAFLNGFSKDEPPTTTVIESKNGESQLKVVDPDTLRRWLVDYSLGELYQSHELEQMPGIGALAA